MSPAAPPEQAPSSTYAYRVPGGETPGGETPPAPRRRGWLRWVILRVLLALGSLITWRTITAKQEERAAAARNSSRSSPTNCNRSRPRDGVATSPIDLGTPLSVDTRLSLRLPPGVSVEGPTGTSVERDYATFVSHYAAEGSVIFASRQVNFIFREVPAARTVDYNAFLHAAQTDQAQLFTLTRSDPASPARPPEITAPNPRKP